MKVRFARKDHEEDIGRLVQISEESLSEPFTEGNFKSTFNNESEHLLIAEDSGEIVGYCDFTLAGPEGELLQIAVDSSKRGKGAGKMLFLEMVKFLREKGVLNLFLEVRKSNVPAKSLYESFGMVPVGERPGFYNNPKEDALIYRLDV